MERHRVAHKASFETIAGLDAMISRVGTEVYAEHHVKVVGGVRFASSVDLDAMRD